MAGSMSVQWAAGQGSPVAAASPAAAAVSAGMHIRSCGSSSWPSQVGCGGVQNHVQAPGVVQWHSDMPECCGRVAAGAGARIRRAASSACGGWLLQLLPACMLWKHGASDSPCCQGLG
jgi:hypothetical protein